MASRKLKGNHALEITPYGHPQYVLTKTGS